MVLEQRFDWRHVADRRQTGKKEEPWVRVATCGATSRERMNEYKKRETMTHLQPTQNVDEHATVEHRLRIDGCDDSIDFLERKRLQGGES